ncbi:hypothetical protein [Acidovorax sp. ACV01]|uniref:hypothetical protein n=1 Tax=Acidovorax sp. ACV01 TaxID=2769311 RepID=UPI001CE20FA7|nr:hypothetical protein [Acidovorax sp. ACV01]
MPSLDVAVLHSVSQKQVGQHAPLLRPDVDAGVTDLQLARSVGRRVMDTARLVVADAIAVPRSILENHPQGSELFRIRIPALRCFGRRIDSRLNGFWALGTHSLDEALLVGGVCLRPFESGDQLGMGNRLIHRGFPFSKAPFSAHFLGICEADGHRHTESNKPLPQVHFYARNLA